MNPNPLLLPYILRNKSLLAKSKFFCAILIWRLIYFQEREKRQGYRSNGTIPLSVGRMVLTLAVFPAFAKMLSLDFNKTDHDCFCLCFRITLDLLPENKALL